MIPALSFSVAWLGVRLDVSLGGRASAFVIEILGSDTDVDDEDTADVPFGFRQ